MWVIIIVIIAFFTYRVVGGATSGVDVPGKNS